MKVLLTTLENECKATFDFSNVCVYVHTDVSVSSSPAEKVWSLKSQTSLALKATTNNKHVIFQSA